MSDQRDQPPRDSADEEARILDENMRQSMAPKEWLDHSADRQARLDAARLAVVEAAKEWCRHGHLQEQMALDAAVADLERIEGEK